MRVERSPRIAYRLRHHVYTPVANTTAGMMMIDIQPTALDCVAVNVTRRSDGSFARMAIRFSCCASQLTVFMNRSRLPSIPRYALAAKSESPTAASRVSGFFSSGFADVSEAGLAAGELAAG